MQIAKKIDITIEHEKYGNYLVLNLFEKKSKGIM